jgi:hypothetical protein
MESSVAAPLKCNNCRILPGNFIVSQPLKQFPVCIKTEVSLVWVQNAPVLKAVLHAVSLMLPISVSFCEYIFL